MEQEYTSETPYFQKVLIHDYYPESGKLEVSRGVNKVQGGKMWCVVQKPSEMVVHRGKLKDEQTIIWSRNEKSPQKVEYFMETVSIDTYEILGYGYYQGDDLALTPRLWYYGNYERVERDKLIGSPEMEAAFMAIIVQNIDTSIQWYNQVLGYDIKNRVDMEERGFRQVNLKRGDNMLELIQINGVIFPEEILETHPDNKRVGGFFKFGFTVSDFDAWSKHVITVSEGRGEDIVTDTKTGRNMMIIKDPDGNRIQFFEK